MAERDRQVRTALLCSGELFGGYNERMAAVHGQNAGKLAQIIEKNGWPGIPLVGEDGAEAAWLVLQHAISNPGLQRRCLLLLEAAAERGEVPAWQVACLEDRICVFEGRPQRYGTQFDWDEDGRLSPHPLQEPDRVDTLRASVGLGPLSEKTKEMRVRAAAEGDQPPGDYRKRHKDRKDWARSVGWR